MLYGCGLRVSEPLNLRIKDVDLQGGRLCIRGAKGGRDRMVSLPSSLIPELIAQMNLSRTVWQRDKQDRLPVMLPHGLRRKYPEYQFSWPWAWLFPAHCSCRDPWSGILVRYRMHEANVQRAVKIARRQLGICVLPHELRHGYATHCLERGVNPRAIQQAMGHSSLETTMGYLHADSLSIRSPLEVLETGVHGLAFQEERIALPWLENSIPQPKPNGGYRNITNQKTNATRTDTAAGSPRKRIPPGSSLGLHHPP
jgi:integrase